MAVPKGKTSKARRDKRRANWKLSAPTMMECPQCHKEKLPHHVCPYCGYYDGKKVMKIAERKNKKAV
ncbi:MAG: large subunit ribosomal protein [Clostridiales bacterium]|jgi:large subunit ribosomal protein L32|nr:large subunit ribosomal protein [Clostridiales bacterium]MDK2992646.1 large subunit ribosomal protein [Clostridiales bacterium]